MRKRVLQKMSHYRFLLLLIAGFLMGQNALAQDINASGVVKDAKGEPLMGVVVTALGTELGTITGMDGDFTLTVPQGSMLEFKQMSFTTQTLRATANMNVTLLDDALTTETVVVVGIGMGTARKSDLTGAISSINKSDMKQGVITSSEQLLQGRIAGLSVVQGSGDPTQGAQLRLRGGSSLSGENSPLVVVDGIAGVDLNTIPAADILSMDVLKDASAAAIYGSRAANGVILVTTKRKDTESRSANYTGYVGIARASQQLDLLDKGQWNENRNEALQFGRNTNWQDEIMQTALTQSHSLTFANMSQKGGVKGSISYLNADGVVKTSKMERLGGTISGFTNLLNDYLTVELSLSKTQDNYRSINGPDDQNGVQQRRLFRATYEANPTWPVLNADGSLFRDPHQPLMLNPLNFLQNHSDDRTRDRFMGFLKTDIWFLKGARNEGLKGTVTLSTNSTDTHERRYVTTTAQESLNLLEGMRGSAAQTLAKYKQEQIEMYLNYDKSWNNQAHRFNAMAGYSHAKEGSEGFGVGVYHFDMDDFLYSNFNAAKNLISVGEGDEQEYVLSGAQYSYSYKNESKITSFFGRVNYSYMSKYMFTATLRADGSSKFGPKHKWGYFPSASFAWRVTQEGFMQGTKGWLDDLKLRVGYGVTGNQGGIASYTSEMSFWPAEREDRGLQSSEPVTDETGQVVAAPALRYVPVRNPNPDLKWESTGQFNAGLDFALWKSRLTGTVEVYRKKTTDLLYFYEVGTNFPVRQTLLNIGELQNSGIELSLNGVLVKTDNFQWAANVIVAHNKNELLKLTDDRFLGTTFYMGLITGTDGPYDGLSSNNYAQQLREGYSIGSFFGAKTAGLNENGELLYVLSNSETTTNINNLTAEDRNHFLGDAMPDLELSFGMNFNYKKFDLGVSTNAAFGQKVYNATAMVLSTLSDTKNVLASSVNTNTTNTISDYWLEDASFFRIQSLTLGYTFDLKEKTKSMINALRLYATVDNPFVFTSYSGVDPEVSRDLNVTAQREQAKRSPGIDNFDNYPKPRTFLFGVNVQF